MSRQSGEYIYQAENLTKDYQVGPQTVHALKDVSLTVAPGEFLAVMGPSGSGKSTFMNLLGCLDTPTRGRLLLNGEEVSAMKGRQRAKVRNQSLGFVFQNFNLLARTSALYNVALPLRYGRTPQKERLKRAEEVLKMVGLGERADHQPSQLSGGQQQRVAIARALVNHPKIILADEPTGALDTQTGREIMALFQELNQRGMTVVLVTHEPEIATFAHRLIRFRDGALVKDEINREPAQAASERSHHV
ncbi:ABC transporter ATP-binding protein [Dethiosulfatarculus sandiegensis]|uniref:ABC transporter ATP-binding protein n=1 Tax=Dethiosulfatarculus sandiegensis TaxID=1429043 RepID=UPI0005C8FDF4|nr:ABC transporter ATP-binding protein [Dethiosulfatarculus sandiegensis]